MKYELTINPNEANEDTITFSVDYEADLKRCRDQGAIGQREFPSANVIAYHLVRCGLIASSARWVLRKNGVVIGQTV